MTLTMVADQNIPHVHEAFGRLAAVKTMAGHAITRAAIRNADILLVRSITRVDADLLHGTRVQFVGSATIGTDHIDRSVLSSRSIAFACAQGANAESVAEYVITALNVIACCENFSLRSKALGIIGCGAIGSRVRQRAKALGMHTLLNDPPLAESHKEPHRFVALPTLLHNSDIVTLHVPLTRTAPHASHHLISASALCQMKPGAWLINTARGAVVDGAALEAALGSGRLGGAILDVWENEPAPRRSLMRAVRVATPHIAGHSYDGKLQGTVQLYQAITRHFGVAPTWNHTALAYPAIPLTLRPPGFAPGSAQWLDALTRQMYDLRADDARTRTLLNVHPDMLRTRFESLRTSYPRRRAFHRYSIPAHHVPPALHKPVRDGLGVQLLP